MAHAPARGNRRFRRSAARLKPLGGARATRDSAAPPEPFCDNRSVARHPWAATSRHRHHPAGARTTFEGAPMPQHYLMCPPTHFTISYQINPWMNAKVATDAALAGRQWRVLRDTYVDLGHTVDVIDPLPQYPDMVYAANGATVIDGIAYSAKFRHNERAGEAPAYMEWLVAAGFTPAHAAETHEGEGALPTDGGMIL